MTTLAAFVLMVVLAGGNAVAIDIVAQELDPFWAAGLRFGSAGLLFAALMAISGVPLPTGRALAGAILYGVLGFGVAFGLAFLAIPLTGAGAAQLLLGLVPLLTLILAPLHRLERFRLRAVVGSLVALAGVAFLAGDRLSLAIPLEGIVLAVAVALLLAEAGVVLKLTPRVHPIATNAVGMLAGTALLLPTSLVLGETWVLPVQSDVWTALGYLVLAGSVGVFWLFVYVIARWSASVVSFEFLLIPMATIPFSALLTDEVVTPAMLLSGAVILVGVYLGVVMPQRAPVPVKEVSP